MPSPNRSGAAREAASSPVPFHDRCDKVVALQRRGYGGIWEQPADGVPELDMRDCVNV